MTDETGHLLLTQHSSQLKMKAACNCGHKQADNADNSLLQLHRTEDQPMTDETGHLLLTQHSSQLKRKAACNCGCK